MASPLIRTKFHMPRPRRGIVTRPRLDDILGRAAESRLTVVSAPAGFGKTTLLASWLAGPHAGQPSVAWLSLTEGDGDPTTFWAYVVGAMQNAVPGIGDSALQLLESGQPPIESVLATVVNELSALPHDVYLVLDDYHLADRPGIQAGMTFLLEHLPPQAHLVITTRADPALPLARLRARGELVEVRAADLRFTQDEAATYLKEAIGRDIDPSIIATLEQRTEGWIAALQLAALSIQGRDDVAGFIEGFSGDDRYVVDYLVEEVLQRLPAHVRSFLLRTSILDRLSAPLCEAVTGERGGRAMLESLDRANLFLVPLDDSRHWYRYHPLFADVLHTFLLDEHPDEVPELHRRASQWHDQAGAPVPAVRHALASGDVDRAADLVELAVPGLQRDRQEAAIRAWLDVIPDEVVRVRPVLAIGFVGALMSRAEFDGVEDRLRGIELLLETSTHGRGGPRSPAPQVVVVDQETFPRLPGAIEMYRAALALVRGDAAATINHAERALDRAPEDDHLTRAASAALSGLASWGSGDLETAHRAYSIAVERLKRVGHISDVLGCSITLADIRITQGRLGDALKTFEEALRLASREGDTVHRGTADMYVGMSRIAFERNDLQTATEHLDRAEELGERAGLPQYPYRLRVARAALREAEGDLAGARALLDDANRVYVGDFSPNVRPVPALRARVLIAQGNLVEALDWAREQGLSAEDELSYVRECEHITLARLLLARHAAHASEPVMGEASLLLERLLVAAEQGGRTGSVIEILVLQARARHARRDVAGALAPLERALGLAEPERYVRVFIGEGQPLASLLRTLTETHPSWDYARRLLDAFAAAGKPASGRQTTPVADGLVEPLSDRELDVLRLLATDLDGPAIARELVVSLNTLRTHTRHIYGKLGVTSRRAAVRRAEQLNLLARPGLR